MKFSSSKQKMKDFWKATKFKLIKPKTIGRSLNKRWRRYLTKPGKMGTLWFFRRKWKVPMISRAEKKRVRRGPVFIMNYCSRQLYLKLHGNSSTMILGWETLITTEQSPGLAEIPGQSDGTWAADVLFYTIPAIKNALLFSFPYICNRESENRFCFFYRESHVFILISVANWWSKWFFLSSGA